MKKILTFCAALALSATGAMADADLGGSAFALDKTTGAVLGEFPTNPTTLPNNAGVVFNFDISNETTGGAFLDPDNTIIVFDTGLPGESVNGFGYDVNLVAGGATNDNAGSWMSEMAFSINNSTNDSLNEALFLFVSSGGANDAAGSQNAFTGGIVKYDLITGQDNMLLADGIMRLEFWETYDDGPGTDGHFDPGSTFSVQVTPEPASLALLALGGFAIIRRRR